MPPKIKFEAGLISPRLEDSVFNEAKAILAQYSKSINVDDLILSEVFAL